MNNSELLIELQRRIDNDDLLIFNEETKEILTGANLKLRENGIKVQITLDKKEILNTRNPSLHVIVLDLDDDMCNVSPGAEAFFKARRESGKGVGLEENDNLIYQSKTEVQRKRERKEARAAAKFLRDQEAVFKPGKGWFLKEMYLGETAIRSKRVLAPGRDGPTGPFEPK